MGFILYMRVIKLSGRKLIILFCCLIFTALHGCRSLFSPIDDLKNIPETIVIGGTKITMKAFLYRDFMPGGETGGSPLIAVVELTAEGAARFPDSFVADRLWVTNRTDTWETGFESEIRPKSLAEPNKIEAVARGGPKWEIGTKADVVVRLRVDGKLSLFIKSLNNEVGAVY